MIHQRVIEEAARIFEVEPADITGRSRALPHVRARQAVAYALHERLASRGFSTTMIGKWLDRDHTTIVYSLQKAEALMVSDRRFAENVVLLLQL